MTDTNNAGTSNVTLSFWIIAVLALLWNSGGAFDYTMTQTQNAAYMASFSEAQLEFFYGFPAWVIALWAIAVWGGVLGSICLLLRRSIATPIFLVSWLAMAATAVHNFLLVDGLKVMGSAPELIFTAAIFFIGLALYLYAKAKTAAGVLR